MAKAKEAQDEYILRSDVSVCSAAIEYSSMDRQISLYSLALDKNGDELAREDESLYSILVSYFSGQPDDSEELKALEDCLLFGLLQIARARAKLPE